MKLRHLLVAMSAALCSVSALATTYANALGAAEEEDARKYILASGRSGIYEPTAAERAELKRAVLPVHKDMEGRLGKEAIQAMCQAAGFDPNR